MEKRVTQKNLQEAYGKVVPDIIAPNLTVLFCGINPGLYTAAIGHHFGKPGNRFWRALYDGGFTDRLFSPYEDHLLLKAGIGITNFIPRATRNATELEGEEYHAGAERLINIIHIYNPHWVGIVGIEAYRKGFRKPKATIGLQNDKIGNTSIWVLPNPSGINAHYTQEMLGALFREFQEATQK